MEVRFWAQTDVGRQRDHNEDNFLIDRKLNLFIVADGMGGHAAGEVASAAAVHEVRRFLVERQGQIAAFAAAPRSESPLKINTLLEGAVRHACARVHQLAQENPARRGMGTTIDVLLVAGGRGFIAHVGDSRVYMLRQGTIHQMTVDHSLVNELIRRGRLQPGQAFESPFKNAVTRAVGVYPSVDVDTMDFDILANDRFLLCSDGLAGYLDAKPDRLPELLAVAELEEAARGLVEFANRAGGKDNITAVIVEALPENEEVAAFLATELQMKLEALKGIPLIRYLNFRELVKLLGITETSEHAPGSALIQEGAPGDSFFVLTEGKVRVFKEGVPIADLEAGAHFGEMALVDSAPRSATVRALEPCKILEIPQQKFYDLLRADPQLAVKLLWAFVQVLTVRLRLSSSELVERKPEQELVQGMASLFAEDEPTAQQAAVLLAESSAAPDDVSLAGALAPEEVLQVRSSGEVLAPESTYRLLEQPAAASPPAPVLPVPSLPPLPPPPPPPAAAPGSGASPAPPVAAPVARPAAVPTDDEDEVDTSPGQPGTAPTTGGPTTGQGR